MGPILGKENTCVSVYWVVKKCLFVVFGVVGVACLFLLSGDFEGEVAQAQVPTQSGVDFMKSLMTSDARDILVVKGENEPINPLIAPSLPCEDVRSGESSPLEKKLYEALGNSPMKSMVPFISQKDKRVAGLLVGIAKIESGFGVASPSRDGKTCFNYWGYKGSGSRGQGMGYACFGSEEEAISVVGGRIETLVQKKLDTPAKMVVWKCGSSCAGHDGEAVQRWIGNVSNYFNRIVQG